MCCAKARHQTFEIRQSEAEEIDQSEAESLRVRTWLRRRPRGLNFLNIFFFITVIIAIVIVLDYPFSPIFYLYFDSKFYIWEGIAGFLNLAPRFLIDCHVTFKCLCFS